MDALERQLKNELLEEVNVYQYNQFKKNYPNFYKAVVRTLRKVNSKNIDSNLIVMDSTKEIKKLSLKKGVKNVFFFAGIFQKAGDEVAVFERVDTFGTYFLKDNKVIRQLKHYKIGLKLTLEGVEENDGTKGVSMIFHQSDDDLGGLFDQDNDYTNGETL